MFFSTRGIINFMNECKSFLPNIDKRSKILILGSMPGIKSLEMQQYYAHPQNRFWKLMGLLCKTPNLADLEYNKRLKILLDNGFALWDVIKYCKRSGSLDSNIYDETPNDISGLLKKYKNVQVLILNGNKAYSALKKHIPAVFQEYKCLKMRSTSPANARYRLENLHQEWLNGIND